MLGGEAIVDAHHHEIGIGRVASARRIEQTELAEDECSSVEVDEARANTVPLGPIDAEGDLGSVGRPWNALFGHLHLFPPWFRRSIRIP